LVKLPHGAAAGGPNSVILEPPRRAGNAMGSGLRTACVPGAGLACYAEAARGRSQTTDSMQLVQAAVFLAAAVIAAPLGRFLRMGAVLGYLAAGVLIAPTFSGRFTS
jgi:hypothetical protein